MNTTQLAMAGVFDGISFGDEIGSDQYSTTEDAPASSSSSGGGGFFGGVNLMGLLSTIGGTWAQIEAAKSGKQVIVKDSTGGSKDIAPELMQKLQQQAQANQLSTDKFMQMMQMQMMQQQQDKSAPKKGNTALYVGLGVGALVLVGGIFYATSNTKK